MGHASTKKFICHLSEIQIELATMYFHLLNLATLCGPPSTPVGEGREVTSGKESGRHTPRIRDSRETRPTAPGLPCRALGKRP